MAASGSARRLGGPGAGRLLVLGAGNQRELAFHTWARLGIDVVLVDGFSHQRYDHMVEECWPWDVRDHAGPDRAALAALLAGAGGVTTLHDFTVVTAAGLAAEAGLPGPGPEAARATRDKRLLRALLQGAGMPGPRWAPVAGADDLERFFAGRGPGDAVLKPADLASSAGVCRVRGRRQAERRLARARGLSFAGTAIVEEYIDGPEYSVEALVRGGATAVVAVTAKETVSGRVFLERQHVVPAPLDGEGRRALVAATGAAVAALGVRDAVVHAELKLAGGIAVPVELACRPAGGLIPDLVLLASGVSLYRSQAALAMGGEPALETAAAPAECRRVAGVRFLVASGVVRRFVEPAGLARRHPGVVAVNQLAQPGRRVPPPAGNWARAGYAVATGPDHDAVERTLRDVVSELGERMGVRELPG